MSEIPYGAGPGPAEADQHPAGDEPSAPDAPSTQLEPSTPPEPPDQPGPSTQPEPTPLPDHAADQAALSDAVGELDAVEAALARLEDGSFDTCEVCGGPIGRDRLLQDPLLTRCPQHSGPSTPAG